MRTLSIFLFLLLSALLCGAFALGVAWLLVHNPWALAGIIAFMALVLCWLTAKEATAYE